MQALLNLPGVQTVAIADEAGRLLGSAGSATPPTTALLVLAHATLTAAGELGRRSGAGDCTELIQNHDGGHILLRGLPHGHVLMVRCLPGTDLLAVSRAAAQLHASQPVRAVRPAPVLDLGDALYAMPAW